MNLHAYPSVTNEKIILNSSLAEMDCDGDGQINQQEVAVMAAHCGKLGGVKWFALNCDWRLTLGLIYSRDTIGLIAQN